MKNDNFVLALRKWLVCDAKTTLLPWQKTAFCMRNNRFCKSLIIKWLYDKYICEKHLHFYVLFLFRKRIMEAK